VLVNLGAHHNGNGAVRTLSTTLIEAGLLSAAVLATLRTLRRRQAQRRPSGRRVPLPGRRLAATELALRTGERPDQVAAVAQAVRALAATLRAADGDVPTILGVVAAPEAIELLINRPLTPPAPWTPAAEGFRWRIETTQLGGAVWQDSEPLPALVPIGRAAGSQADVLLNLEAAGLLWVRGQRADGVVRAIASSLTGTPWAGSVNVVSVGFGAGLDAAEHVRAVATVEEIFDELQSTVAVMAPVIAGADPFHGRVRERSGDGWPPTVVLCTSEIGQEQTDRLARLAGPGTGLVAVIAGATPLAGWTLDVDGDPMAVQPLRLAIEPTILNDTDFGGIGELYQLAEQESGADPDAPPYDSLEISADRKPRLAPLTFPSAAADKPPVLVRVLGTIELEGVGEFKRPKSRELAVYLSLHPSGVGEAELDEAMWPSTGPRLVSPSTRDSTVSVARTALGGPGRLLPAQVHGREKRYQVSTDVVTDWALFCELHRKGRAERDSAVVSQALELVRGRPFDGVLAARTYGWVHTEGHARQMEAEIGDAADLAAELLLADGRALEARAAARCGLLADPYLERLWVRLMEVADQLGDSQEVERIMDELDRVLELNGDFAGLHPQTLAAYERLSRRHRLPR
jgi:DNA-binding SARP family transcriptional activator